MLKFKLIWWLSKLKLHLTTTPSTCKTVFQIFFPKHSKLKGRECIGIGNDNLQENRYSVSKYVDNKLETMGKYLCSLFYESFTAQIQEIQEYVAIIIYIFATVLRKITLLLFACHGTNKGFILLAQSGVVSFQLV